MENEKNAQADLSKRNILFFQIGLILSLFLVWQLIEWKAGGQNSAQGDFVYVDQFEEEEVPIRFPDFQNI